ncbi:Dopamine D2-like receptor like protein [Argiope bruennichi]|uniref:Dopamine D2-like receptor like protein n=1 Tax=Argiope bruennichi TaxID=94029 RepID=A0A8T0FN08_ARGBR|nr:Dopamine D2-like receptor like protein [Argiope bruennichi]
MNLQLLNSSDLYDDLNTSASKFVVFDNFSSCQQNNCSLNDSNNEEASSFLQAGKVYWALMMIPLPLVAVFGNILVILSVYKERNLQSATNYFIVSLAFADLLVAAVVMPFAVYVLVNVDWELSDTLCDFYIALDVTCSTASIFNLVAISVDRFIAVTQPIKYSKHKNNKRIFLTIIFVWLVSAAIGSPIVLGLNTSPERQPNLCVFYNSDFIIYSSLSSFYIPCLVMVYLYYKIFRAIHERARKALGQKMPQRSRNPDNRGLVIENTTRADEEQTNSKSDSSRQSQGIAYIKTLSPLIEGDEGSQMYHSENVDDEDDDEESPTADCQVITNVAVSSFVNDKSPSPLNDVKVEAPYFKVNGSTLEDKDFKTTEQKKAKNRFKLVNPTAKSKKKKREKNAARRERKATKTLAIVLETTPEKESLIMEGGLEFHIETWKQKK